MKMEFLISFKFPIFVTTMFILFPTNTILTYPNREQELIKFHTQMEVARFSQYVLSNGIVAGVKAFGQTWMAGGK